VSREGEDEEASSLPYKEIINTRVEKERRRRRPVAWRRVPIRVRIRVRVSGL